MRDILHRFGKFYSRVVIDFIGIFMFVGILSVLFGENGWIPIKEIYAISVFVYHYVLPVMIAFAAGNQMRGGDKQEKSEQSYTGGCIAVMATTGLLMTEAQIGLFGAMILGPVCGFLWYRLIEPRLRQKNIRVEMLVRNLLVALVGVTMALLTYYGLEPSLEIVNHSLMAGIRFLVNHHLLFLLSFLIEPLKVIFFNNGMNHGVLIPLGMQQLENANSSNLFLLETNPGPGLGVLLALYWHHRKQREEYRVAVFAELIGGIHEVYFPEILSNLPLLASVIAGGTVGNLWFSGFHLGTASVVSPGSIITILFVSPKDQILGICLGVLVSAVVSLLVAKWILLWQDRKKDLPVQEMGHCVLENDVMREIKKIGFVCDAGVGSSSMGAALLRRKLKEMDINHVEVAAYAMDQVPQDLDLLICQKNFKELLLKEIKDSSVLTMDNLLNQAELAEIAEMVSKRSGS